MTVWQGNQPAQVEFLRHFAPGWYLYEGGYGAGKSWAGARKLIAAHLANACPSAVYAPTYGDLWRICVPELCRAIEELGQVPKVCPHGSATRPFPHVMLGAEPIIVQSADDPARVAGYEIGAAWLDEGARLPESASVPQRDAPTQIRARLRHPRAKLGLFGFVTTTPEGTETWVQRDFREKPQPRHWAFRGRTAANTALTPEYAVSIRAAFGEELAQQYLEGIAVDYRRDVAHPTFRAEGTDCHVTEAADWPASGKVTAHVGADFNVSPLCWIAGWLQGDTFNVSDELVVDDFAQVDDAMRRANDKGWGQHGPVTIHPDRSGAARNRVGDPECTVIEREARRLKWTAEVLTYGANPPVNQRINLVSRALRDGCGVARLRIHPRCRRLIDEMKRTGRKGSGYDPGKEGKRGHILDALGYALWDVQQPAKVEAAGLKL